MYVRTSSRSLGIIRAIIVAVLFVLVIPLPLAALVWSELRPEARFHNLYGANWRVRYEEIYGPLAKAHARLAMTAVLYVAIVAFMIWLYRLLRHKRHSPALHRSGWGGARPKVRLFRWSLVPTMAAEAVLGRLDPLVWLWSGLRRHKSMTPFGFFGALKLIFSVGLVVLGGLGVSAGFIWSELSTEAKFRSMYGTSWRSQYEEIYGPLATAHTKIAMSAVAFVAVSALVVWLYRHLRRDGHTGHSSGSRQRRSSHRYGSPLERAAAYRKKAVVGIYFGLVGIMLGILLVIFRIGMFSRHSDEMVLGIFVFLAGYSGIIAGCSYWLKAKQWNEAIVFIGLMPLVIPLIPFVRLVLLAAPLILPAGMVMMPLILLVVVATLPDRSGASRRRHRAHGSGAAWRQIGSLSAETNVPRPAPSLAPTPAAGDSPDTSKAPSGGGRGSA